MKIFIFTGVKNNSILHRNNVSHIMRKHAYCMSENKDTDQLLGYLHRYDQSLYLNPKDKVSCRYCTGRIVSDLVANPEARFPGDTAQIMKYILQINIPVFHPRGGR